MNDQLTRREARLQEAAAAFPYPPTPDIAAAVVARIRPAAAPAPRRLRPGWALAVVLALVLLAGTLLAVPQVRAAVWQLLRAGAIQIFLPEPSATPPAAPGEGPLATPQASPPITATPAPPLADALFDPASAVTLAEAQAAVPFTLQLPAYPPDLGLPDQVFVHDAVAPPTVVLVWRDGAAAEAPARLSLYQIGARDYAAKGADSVEETTVDGQPAFWLQGPHYFVLRNNTVQPWLFVAGNVLLWWTDEGITYRLESHLSLEEARRTAASLQPVMEES